MPLATTIDEVIARLEGILAECDSRRSGAGYFAALYHKVTCRVRDGIAAHEFEDGARMEQLDVTFANRYIAAWDAWRAGGQPTASWKTAFESTRRRRVLVLQHLLLGMNAHINLDLGIATVAIAQGGDLAAAHRDFNEINTILAALTYEVVNDLNRVSPLLSLLGFHATNYNAVLMQFALSNARDGAWCFAEELYTKQGDAATACIAARDVSINLLAQGLTHAKGLMRITLGLIWLFEWHNPRKIIGVMRGYRKKFLKMGTT